LRIRAAQRVEVDLADRTPIGAHLWNHTGRQRDLRQALENTLAIPRVELFVIENQFQIRQPEERKRAQVHDVWNSVHHDFQRNRDLLLDLLRGNSRPLRDDLDVVVGNVRIRFDGQLVKRNCAPNQQQRRCGENQNPVLQRKIDKLTNHRSIPFDR
jgi:hypothetical protein